MQPRKGKQAKRWDKAQSKWRHDVDEDLAGELLGVAEEVLLGQSSLDRISRLPFVPRSPLL